MVWLGAIGMRQIKEVMTTRVVTVTPSTPFKEAVEVLAAHKVAAAPVVDEDGWVVGVVSEADLLLKEEYPRDQSPAWASGYVTVRTRRGRVARS